MDILIITALAIIFLLIGALIFGNIIDHDAPPKDPPSDEEMARLNEVIEYGLCACPKCGSRGLSTAKFSTANYHGVVFSVYCERCKLDFGSVQEFLTYVDTGELSLSAQHDLGVKR